MKDMCLHILSFCASPPKYMYIYMLKNNLNIIFNVSYAFEIIYGISKYIWQYVVTTLESYHTISVFIPFSIDISYFNLISFEDKSYDSLVSKQFQKILKESFIHV